ncbi:hypothetical protein COO91_03458 [Nostoc flagelliforme CCNUN1]|uniref:Uncharacterized protein n=1 Tax=Nostoc flagelliforme CCNUN1 TaxID=2038116 RepID=A0A2K8SQD1_9NOSO|nr:hypothetical protein [Nostoc flagelliforme]AUB37513.1 hypothetical protein COO91_03458 [Nostoc flagelliforme CCNUN1]
MVFTFPKTENYREIKEREHGINPDVIGFTAFTSCLGIVAILPDNNLIGIHMAILNEQDEVFGADPQDIPNVLNLVKDNRKVIIVGIEDCWGGELEETYTKLKEGLGNPPVILTEDGVFHAKKDGDNDIKVMLCVKSEPQPQQGQTSRSSEDFSTIQPQVLGEERIKITLPDGISVKIAENIANGNDPAVFENVENGREEQNPNKNKLYVADPTNANEDFFVCFEKV